MNILVIVVAIVLFVGIYVAPVLTITALAIGGIIAAVYFSPQLAEWIRT